MGRIIYVMDSCSCITKKKPKRFKGVTDTYECSKCGVVSLGYDEW